MCIRALTLTTLRLVLQASMTAEEGELVEEAEAIKAAQRTAKQGDLWHPKER